MEHDCSQSDKIEKIYTRLFENNGNPSLITEVENLKKFKKHMEEVVIANIKDIQLSLGKMEKEAYGSRIINETLDHERQKKTDKSDRFWKLFAIITSCVFGGATIILTILNMHKG